METTVRTSADAPPALRLDDRAGVTDQGDIYLDGALVLVGCGKAKRDPEDPVDLHLASVGPDEELRPDGPLGPAWRAEDLYTSTYFAVKREFAEVVTHWARGHDAGPWAVLSAEHGVLPHWQDVKPYDTTISDIGDDPTNEDHWVRNSLRRRRPDGEEIVTEMDQWAATVAYSLCKWVSGFRASGAHPTDNAANTLLVLAGKDYVEPLRSRGVFEYGIQKMTNRPNQGFGFPLRTRYLFEEIDAGGIGEQMAWLSDSVDKLEAVLADRETGSQGDLGSWTGEAGR